jgi:hypothetical protein
MNFRQAAGKQLLWKDTGVGGGFSNFLFVEQNYGSNSVLRRIFSQARKQDYQSVLVEEISEAGCALLAEENQALAIRRPDYRKSVAHRISFFLSPSGTPPKPSDFLGYAVLKLDHFLNLPSPRVHVFESVMRPCRGEAHNTFTRCARDYRVTTGLGQLSVSGVLYAKQNTLTYVCAHVGLRTVLASVLPEADITYGRINALAGIDHKSSLVGEGAGGLKPDQIDKVFSGLNLNVEKLVHEPSKHLTLPTEYQRQLYGFIESGCPALIGFEADPKPGQSSEPARHAIPVFGHTFDEDAWLPDAHRLYFGGSLSYYPSENWLGNFVIHDDNFGPYFYLPRHFLKKDNFRLMYGLKGCASTFNAVDAEAIAFAFCDAIRRRYPRLHRDWYDRFAIYTQRGWLVLRTLMIGKADYLRHIREVESREHDRLEPEFQQHFEQFLPAHFWMVEASAPELFACTRRKFGELLLAIDKPAQPLEFALLLAARLPGFLLLNPGGGNINIRITKLIGHTPLFAPPSAPRGEEPNPEPSKVESERQPSLNL